MAEPDAIHFLNEAYKHCKAIALSTAAKELLNLTYFAIQKDKNEQKSIGVVVGECEEFIQQFIKAITSHRFWEREMERKVPA